jgi:exodeoxyribonuclease VII large subunit
MTPTLSPAEFVALVNQTLDYAYPVAIIVGEVKNLKISRNMWVYFDIADDSAKVKCFTTVYKMPVPIEDGMKIQVIANPNLHNQFGFSLNVQSMQLVGEGVLKKANDLLKLKLEKEGLFDPSRKRPIPYGPELVGVITSEQSAACADFVKILESRWLGVNLEIRDTVVQGESAPESIIASLQYFNQLPHPPEVITIIRGGGSADDLQAFNHELVVRAIASSRVPTVVAIGHETDESYGELAADLRASTPSNAAELLFPDKKEVLRQLKLKQKNLQSLLSQQFDNKSASLQEIKNNFTHSIDIFMEQKQQNLRHAKTLFESIHPKSTLKRGYALLEKDGKLVSSTSQLAPSDSVKLTLKDGQAIAEIVKVQ